MHRCRRRERLIETPEATSSGVLGSAGFASKDHDHRPPMVFSQLHEDSSCCRRLGWEDPLEEGMATHSSILAFRILMDRGAWRATVHGVAKSGT